MLPSPICRELKSIRGELSLTLSQISDRLSLPVSTLRDWEEGHSSPTLASLERWCRALGYELDLHPISNKKVQDL